jgi:glycosyltransferase involved in cell wall biosynthesis
MKIVSCVRTYNEQRNIVKCCQAYPFADKILIADGGSTDNTVSIAKEYKNVEVREFTTMVECRNGIWRNPDGEHINFLLDWANEEQADWIILQDCDQRPNKYLKQDARKIFENSEKDFILITQLFLWGDKHYFPDLSGFPNWMQGLWGWRANINLRVIDKMPHFEFSYDGEHSVDINQTGRTQRVMPPCCYMHFGWPTEEQTQKHLDYYRQSGLIGNMLSPLQFGGRLALLLDWMIE